MNDLERSEGLSCSTGHHKEYSLLTFSNSFYSSIYRNALIIPWLMRIGIKIIRSLN